MVEPTIEQQLDIRGMTCASCAVRLEKTLAKVAGVKQAQVNLATEVATLNTAPDVSTEALVAAVRMAGFDVAQHQLDVDITGMTCASCVSRVEKGLAKLPGVSDVGVNLATGRAHLTANRELDFAAVAQAVKAVGFTASLPEDGQKVQTADARLVWWPLLVAGLLTLPLDVPMIWRWFSPQALMLPGWLQWLLATPVQFWLGARFYRAGFLAVRAGSGNMDLLVALGTSAAYFLSVWLLVQGDDRHLYFDSSATVITLVMLGKWLEVRARYATSAAIRALAALRPERATVRRDGKSLEIPLVELVAGDTLLVRPGERLAADGVVQAGTGMVDESMVTGESFPVDKVSGSTVIAGTVNLNGFLEILVRATGKKTLLAQIIEQVEAAQVRKAPIQRLADKVSAVFVPVVIGIALLTFAGWWLAGADLQHASLAAVAVLVIACPCALGLATPVALMAGTGVAARHGILIQDVEALEVAHRVSVVAFDKTGTLTSGKIQLVAMQAEEGDESILLRLAASLQQGSEHPLARAIDDAAREKGLELLPVQGMHALPGLGVEGLVDGRHYWLGSAALLQQQGLLIEEDSLSERMLAWLAMGESGALRLIGRMEFTDPIKPGAAAAVAALRGMGIYTAMLSGDRAASATLVAQQLALDTVEAGLLPADKTQAIRRLQQSHGIVAMVGDGINDAPALATADVSMAMASGTDVAMQVAAITLMRGDVMLVPAALDISRRTWQKIRQNLFFAFIYNLIGIPLAASGKLDPAFAGAAMAMSSVSVVSNALLLSRWRPFKKVITKQG